MVSIKNSKEIRKTILRMIAKSQSSHIWSALSIVDILNVIYWDVFQENDKVILSKWHAWSALYATLAEYWNINKKILINNYCQNWSKFWWHVTYWSMSWVDASAWSLGHWMPIWCWFALANKRRKVFVITWDWELNEWSNRESVMFWYHQRLSNLIRIIDKNNQQSFGDTQETIKIHDLFNILESFWWHVQEVNWHNINELRNAFNNTSTTLPNVIIANTIKGKWVSFMENNVKFHYKPPTSKELDLAINELDTWEMN
jgi:transketolase